MEILNENDFIVIWTIQKKNPLNKIQNNDLMERNKFIPLGIHSRLWNDSHKKKEKFITGTLSEIVSSLFCFEGKLERILKPFCKRYPGNQVKYLFQVFP